MDLKRCGTPASSKGPAQWFTGGVRIDPLYQAEEPARTSGASVTLEPDVKYTRRRAGGGGELLGCKRSLLCTNEFCRPFRSLRINSLCENLTWNLLSSHKSTTFKLDCWSVG
jgi:hypothetical protein